MDALEVKQRVQGGASFLLARRVLALLINLLTTYTIARLVSPRAYGLAAMSTVVFSFADMFKDFGLTSALLRKGSVDADEVSFLFWFNAATTVLLAIAIAASASVVAAFFHEPVVAPVMLVSLIGFTIGGLSLQHRALLNRDLRFKALASIDSTALIVQYAVTLALALIWHGVWAIVIGATCSAVTSAALMVPLSGWVPSAPRRIQGLRSVLLFGANTSVFSFSAFVSNAVPSILIGRVLGSAQLGQYNRAAALVSLPLYNLIEPITQATLPVLTRLRPQPELYRQTYLELIGKLNLIAIPLSVVLVFAAEPLVLTLLGAKWRVAGKVLAALAPNLAGMGFAYAVGDLFITQDRSSELRGIGLFELVVRAAAVAVGVYMGIIAAALAYSASTLIAIVVRIWVAGRRGPVTARDHLRTLAPALPASLGAAVGCAIALTIITDISASSLVAASLTLASGVTGAAGAGLAARDSRRIMLEIARIFVPHIGQTPS